jgi:hypothetical protein
MKAFWMLGTLLLSAAGPALRAQAPPAPIEIKLAHGDAAETQTRDQLLRLLRTYDLNPWIFTRTLIIDSSPRTVPHSHPVLTLSTRHIKDDDLLLSTFVHENLHHFLVQNREKTEAAKKELHAVFPKVPVGYPDGADSEDSGYEHLIVCYLEYRADKEIWGEQRAFQVVQFWMSDHYRWIYRQLLEAGYQIGPIVQKNGLIPGAPSEKPAANPHSSQ